MLQNDAEYNSTEVTVMPFPNWDIYLQSRQSLCPKPY